MMTAGKDMSALSIDRSEQMSDKTSSVYCKTRTEITLH